MSSLSGWTGVSTFKGMASQSVDETLVRVVGKLVSLAGPGWVPSVSNWNSAKIDIR